MTKRIAIIGGGLTGLSAAYDLLQEGHDVTIFESTGATGGLAQGFSDENWRWPLERFYHHLFETDDAILTLVEELGIKDKLFFPRPITSMYYKGRIYPFDSVPAFFRYPGFGFFDTLRFGGVSLLLRYTRFWRWLERQTADRWMRRWYGKRVYEATWRPMLINKFGHYYDKVPMSWMWARLYARSFRLGYFEGGFQTFVDALSGRVRQMGGRILLKSPIQRIEQREGLICCTTRSGVSESFDDVLVTVSPQRFLQMTPAISALHEDYAKEVAGLKSIGAIVLVAALRWPLLKKTYWLNIPTDSPEKSQQELPFLAVVEHTNYVDNKHYGGDHIVYLGDYLPTNHAYFDMTQAQIEEVYYAGLKKINPNFSRDWVRKSWLFKAKYAQPVPFVKQSRKIPSIETPIPHLYLANMSQIYPWDRGTNFAVELGRRVAKMIMK